MKDTQKRIKREYKSNARPSGVFLIRNVASDKVFLASGLDLQGTMNRHRFQLVRGIHPNRQLQSDWSNLGAENFAFEILEETEFCQTSQSEAPDELRFMEDLWLEKLKPFAQRGYNQPKLSKEEKLRRIAAKRNSEF